MPSDELASLEGRIGYTFKDPKLLEQAVTHRSYLNEHPDWPVGHNERLEFLGDAVLELVVTEYIYSHYPDRPEGEMTNWRAALVNANTLSAITGEFGLNDCMLLSRGEARDTAGLASTSWQTQSRRLSAQYLDGAYEPCKVFIGRFVLTHLPDIIEKRLYRDSKSLLQEQGRPHCGYAYVQGYGEWGPDHALSSESASTWTRSCRRRSGGQNRMLSNKLPRCAQKQGLQ